jgi:hypothetical protein
MEFGHLIELTRELFAGPGGQILAECAQLAYRRLVTSESRQRSEMNAAMLVISAIQEGSALALRFGRLAWPQTELSGRTRWAGESTETRSDICS